MSFALDAFACGEGFVILKQYLNKGENAKAKEKNIEKTEFNNKTRQFTSLLDRVICILMSNKNSSYGCCFDLFLSNAGRVPHLNNSDLIIKSFRIMHI